jgi:hypothetical protein
MTRYAEATRIENKLQQYHWREGITPGTRWTVEKLSRNIHRVTMMAETAHAFEWHGLLSSDRHHDNAHTDQELERKHLVEITKRKGGVIDAGDFFCCMQGRWDVRADRSALRPEYQCGDYLDALVREAVRFYGPYADRFVVINRGNHETAIQKRHETDLTERLCAGLSSTVPVYSGGYGGYVLFRLVTKKGGSYSFKVKVYHGSGGGAVMTHGTLDTRRHASIFPDADMVVTGHSHHHWVVPIARERIRQFLGAAETVIDEQLHVRVGTYKDEHGDGYGGWAVEKGLPPKGLGAVWMRLFIAGKQGEYRLAAEVQRAQ